MQQLLPWLLAAVPIVILPGISFYFDVIPRLALLLVVVSVVLVMRAPEFHHGRLGRWFLTSALVYVASLTISSALSVNPSLSIYGSTWRRFGLITQLAVTILAVILAGSLAKNRVGIRYHLQAFAACGLLAAAYGIFQYFGKDPLLDSSQYHVGEGVWTIVRPPGTAGHANYFGVYLLMVAFSAAAVAVSNSTRAWRLLGFLTVAVAALATVLTGTRGALVGALAGGIVVVARLRPRLTRANVTGAVLLSSALAGFYVSPAGERLRARARWAIEDPRGGARLRLWRDTLRMAATRPIVGFGPETYGAEFPRFQSVDLARAYPDFHHESPHNVELDVLIAQGFPGLAAFALMLLVAIIAGLRAPPECQKTAAVLLGCLTALVVSQQFYSPTIVTALCTSITLAFLVALTPGEARSSVGARRGRASSSLIYAARIVCAVFFIGYALRITVADRLLDETRDSFAANDIPSATAHYGRAAAWLPGASADLYYSRSMARAASEARDPSSAVQAWQHAILAGQKALHTSDEPANAAYNLATLHAAANDAARTEKSLRTAVSKAPNWFKPHWMLARVLALSGRWAEAEAFANAAYERNGNVNPEVLQTVREIKEKRSPSR